ncbi:MAG: bifunctional nuclease domain-containing protein [Cyclobacteriaceae bacterium]
MDKIRLEILGLSSSQSQTGSFALVLGEMNGNRRLPIIIGMFEAQAIAIEIERITPNRPMTHDLFKSFAHNFSFEVKEVLISDLKEGVFFAKLICGDEIKTIEIDSRPSDAIAIGIRFGVPIYTYESVLSEAGIVLTDESGEESEELAIKEETVSAAPTSNDDLKDYTTDKLQTMLTDALAKEDYEGAAKIRDEINRRN